MIRSSRGCATRLHSRSVPSARVTANCEVEQTPRVDSSAGCSRLADAPLYTSRPTDWPWMLPRSEIVGAIDSRCCYFSSDISLASGVPPKASPGSLSRLVVGRPPSKHGLAATLLTSSLVVWLKSRLGTLTRLPANASPKRGLTCGRDRSLLRLPSAVRICLANSAPPHGGPGAFAFALRGIRSLSCSRAPSATGCCINLAARYRLSSMPNSSVFRWLAALFIVRAESGSTVISLR